MSVVFAVSSALITRDLDPNSSIISRRCVEDVLMISQRTPSAGDPIDATKWTCTALCALALCELISPTSGQLWDLLGRAMSMLDDLCAEYHLVHRDLDDDYRRIERSLLKLECSTAMHFRRPSPFCAMRLSVSSDKPSVSTDLPDELKVMSHLFDIAERFTTLPRPSDSLMESLIPLQMQLASTDSHVSIQSATLYTALHPLLTDWDMATKGMLDSHSKRLRLVIAHSASTVINHFARLDGEKRIISLWMAADKVLEAGLVWATYLMHRRTAPTEYEPSAPMGPLVAMSPILKVSALLASFSARWESGIAHAQAWESLVELLWNVV
ncbi:hypothetical protein A1O1_08758 [Capronia coronata CBS 617.96]|uniref:Transcription factor domain-containing protein n=1 Tax=Capronia coronata CBS 617.96 TaxID=1182541 RepID=W9YAU6_9EURO|nr:uncharacterized protein A1O1_08758 [Capronia coronata CBS 617.96]EXJ79494.1 hypothetical protein A1O1_08758 [Capronia coronata CBS 617.96]